MVDRGTRAALGAMALLVGCSKSYDLPDSSVRIDGGDATSSSDTSTGGAELVIDPSLQNFGDIQAGESVEVGLEVSNVGAAPAIDLRAETRGDPAFSIAANDCPDALAPGERCIVRVRCRGETHGTVSGTLEVSERRARAIATLEARILLPHLLTVTPTPHDFGSVWVGSTSSSITLTVRNQGLVPSGPLTWSLGGAHSTQFRTGPETCRGVALARPRRHLHHRGVLRPVVVGHAHR
jgi:hypothetical protein